MSFARSASHMHTDDSREYQPPTSHSSLSSAFRTPELPSLSENLFLLRLLPPTSPHTLPPRPPPIPSQPPRPAMYPLTFISASPPIRQVIPSATTPLMIAAPKRRGRPPKLPPATTPSLQSHSRRSNVAQPQPEHGPRISTSMDIFCQHQHHINAEQAALAVLEAKPHLLTDEHSLLANPESSAKSNPRPKNKHTKRRRPDNTTHPLSTSRNRNPAPAPVASKAPITSEPPDSREITLSSADPLDHSSHLRLEPSQRAKPSTRIKSASDNPQSWSSQHSASKGTKAAKPDTKNEPVWTSNSSAADNTVRWYLQLIGGDRLLRPEEEVELGRKIRHLMAWQRKLVELADSIGREPTVEEWAQYLDEDPDDFKKRLFDARRAKDRMVVCNLRLVVSIAKRYLNRGMPLSDLIQEGTLGLIRACEKFDAEKGFKFSTYATWWVRQAVSRSIADQSRTVRLPVHLYDTITAIRRATKYLTNELGRPPLEQEIADYCNITIEKLRATRVNMQAAMPLDCPLSATDDALTLSDVIESDEESPEDRVESSLLRDDLEHVVNSLTPRERDVVRMRYGLDDGRAKTLEEIGRVFDVTKERVRQIESKALRKLRHPYRSAVLREYTPPES